MGRTQWEGSDTGGENSWWSILAQLGQDGKPCKREEGLARARCMDVCPPVPDRRQSVCQDAGVTESQMGHPKPESPFGEFLAPKPIPQSWVPFVTIPGPPKSTLGWDLGITHDNTLRATDSQQKLQQTLNLEG